MTGDTRGRLIGIGELSRSTGVPVRTIRFYCDEGVLGSSRSSVGHRVFDPVTAVGQLLMIRRLRALGIGLDAIVAVLSGVSTVAEVIAAERGALEDELAALAWRRASLLAVEDAAPEERAERLEVLAAVQDRHRVYDSMVAFWRELLDPLSPELLDGFILMNVPDLTTDRDPRHIVAYAELAMLVADPGFRAVMSRQLWRSDETRIRHKRPLLTGVAEACESAGHLILARQPPRPGPELDRFVDAHAAARGIRDTPRFRRQLLSGATDSDPRIHRYWNLTGEVIGAMTTGAAQDWLYRALEQSAGSSGHPRASARRS
ncbi:MerR family transcriptional regulator [Nocardia sp. NPDC020380]|uniref:helix-turn-helix domain-containing protein n=1 Tax=Nocardia sp. NPDC020380 TaxID=3364309 RepID=UPI00379B8B01